MVSAADFVGSLFLEEIVAVGDADFGVGIVVVDVLVDNAVVEVVGDVVDHVVAFPKLT